MIERYTEKAVKVILFAQEEAFMARHEKLFPEHILLGILREGSGLSSKLLKASGLRTDILRETVHKRLITGNENQFSMETLPFSAAVKKVLREAWYDVQSSGTYYVTPENLFLSLISEKESSVVQLLNELDINITKIKTSVEKISTKGNKPFVHPEDTAGSTNIPHGYFDKNVFTEDEEFKKIITVAEEKLNQTNHEAFGTEQLFQAVIENKDSWIVKLIEQEGINTDNFLEKLRNIDSRKDEYNKNEPEFTPKAYKAVYSAYDIAKELGSTHVKAEHLLLGILKENDGIACSIIKDLGLNTDNLYRKIIAPIEKEKPEILTIIKLAKEEAARMEQNIIGTEQILLGILGEGTGIASQVLRGLGITLKDARREVQKIIGYGHHYSEENEIVFTPRAKRIISLAWRKARKLKKEKYTSEHLLLAITGEKESIAMKVLENLGVDTLEIRQGILNERRESLPLDIDE